MGSPSGRNAAAEDRSRLQARYAACIAMGLRDEAEHLARPLGVEPAEMEAHVTASAHALDDWLPPDFEDFTALPPGRFDPRVFHQRPWWVDALRRPHRITDPDDFTTEHLHAVIAYIRASAWRWADFPDLSPGDSVNLAWFYAEAARRIEQTPLMRALLAEADRRAASSRGPG